MAKDFKENHTAAAPKNKIIIWLLALLVDYFYIFAFVLALITVAGGLIFVIKPKYDSIKADIAAKYDAQTQNKADMEDYLLNLNKYKKAFDAIKDSEKAKIDSMVEANIAPEDLFARMSSIISSQGLMLTAIDINQENKDSVDTQANDGTSDSQANWPPELGKTEMTLTIIGVDYRSLKNLLAVFENDLKLTDVEQLKFSPTEKSVSLTVNQYYLK